jgi:hypothetical protein
MPISMHRDVDSSPGNFMRDLRWTLGHSVSKYFHFLSPVVILLMLFACHLLPLRYGVGLTSQKTCHNLSIQLVLHP